MPGTHLDDFRVSLEKDSTFSWHLLTSVVTVGWADSVRCADADETVTREPDLVGVPAVGETVTATGERAILNTGTHTESVEWFRGCDTARPPSRSAPDGRTSLAPTPSANGSRRSSTTETRSPAPASPGTRPATRPPWSGRSPPSPPPRCSAGSAVTGSALSLAAPAVSGTVPVTTALSWESCDAAGCAAVGTDPTYTPVASDVGHSIRAVVTVTNAWGAASRTSAPSAVVVAAPTGAADLGPTTLSFSAVAGTTSATQTATYTNGTNAERRIAAVTLTGTGFQRSGGDCYARVVLAAGESCTVTLAFAPGVDGPATGQLTVDDGTPHAVALSGTASRGGRLTASASSLSFGKVRVHTKATRSVRVSNTGTQAFSIGSIALSGAQRRDFKVVGKGCAKAVLAPGQACVVTVALKPRAAGVRRAALTIGSTAAQPVRVVALSGRAR